MALVWADKVAETSTTTGTGAFTLAGAITGYRAFSSVMTSPSDTCYYMITAVDSSGVPTGDWEAGLGTYSASNTLTRTTVHASTNGGSAVSFAAGTKRVTLSQTASAITPLTRRLASSATATGTPAATTETDLLTYTMPGGTLSSDGSVLRVQASGTWAATTRSRTVRLYLGTTVIVSFSSTSSSNVLWNLDALIIRVDATNQRVKATMAYGAVATNVNANIIVNTTAAETLANSLAVKVTGQVGGSPVANDIVGNIFLVELVPA